MNLACCLLTQFISSHRLFAVGLVLLMTGQAAVSNADSPPENSSDVAFQDFQTTIESLQRCSLERDSTKRLQCYDDLATRAASTNPANAALAATAADNEAVPALPLPVESNQTFAEPRELRTISVQLIEARRSSRDYWILTFNNGQVWRQNDSRRRAIRGLPLNAKITETMLGGHKMKLEGQRWSMKIRRLR